MYISPCGEIQLFGLENKALFFVRIAKRKLKLIRGVIFMTGKNRGKTVTFTAVGSRESMIKETMNTVYLALKEKGYDPINQLVGYILSEDPTYITNYNNARGLICKLDRDELLRLLVSSYLDVKPDIED